MTKNPKYTLSKELTASEAVTALAKKTTFVDVVSLIDGKEHVVRFVYDPLIGQARPLKEKNY